MAHTQETKGDRETLPRDVAANEPRMQHLDPGMPGGDKQVTRAIPNLGEGLKIALEHITVPGDKMLIQELDPESVTDGGIILPDMSQQKRNIAKVLKLSPGLAQCKELGIPGSVPIGSPEVGDYVTYAKYVTSESAMEEIGPRVCVLNFDDVLAVLKPEAIENVKDQTRQAATAGTAPNPVAARDPSQENRAGNPQSAPRRD